MPRLFIGEREFAFISDITKELTKDVSGQKIFYYAISAALTRSHDVYGEATKKVFEPPIEIEVLAPPPEYGTTTTAFGSDQTSKIDVYVQLRDLVDKGIEISVGDFFTYGEITYEITSVNYIKPMYGQVESKDGLKITGTRARSGQLDVRPHGPTDASRADPDARQERFVQQRGEASNALGQTNDVRSLIASGVLDRAITGPREVSRHGSPSFSSFYDE